MENSDKKTKNPPPKPEMKPLRLIQESFNPEKTKIIKKTKGVK